jgi:hypothetical protein
MANNGSDDDGVANKGFGRRSLHQWEGRLLYAAGYPAPPNFRAPGGWRLMRANSTNVVDEGLRVGETGRRMTSKVKSVKQGGYRK